jgi:hypothetical protein
MRNVIGLSVVLLMCAALSSCSGNRPEKAFMGTWEGKHEGELVEFSFMEKNICIWVSKTHDVTKAGTWTIDPEGNARITVEGGEAIATLMNDGKIIAREVGGPDAVVLEKSDSKKK